MICALKHSPIVLGRSASSSQRAIAAFRAQQTPHRATRLILLAARALPLWLVGCSVVNGSGDQVSEERKITAASKVAFCCGFDVDLEQSAKAQPSLLITTDDNLIDDIKVTVQGGTISVEWVDGWTIHHPSNGVHIELVLPDLQAFSGSGGTSLNTGNITTDRLDLALSGGSRANLGDLRADEFQLSASGGSVAHIDQLISEIARVENSGGSELTAQGTTQSLTADLSGGAKLVAEALVNDQVQLSLSGGSSARLNVTGNLTVSASGGSEVWVSGDPTITSSLSGGSELHQN